MRVVLRRDVAALFDVIEVAADVCISFAEDGSELTAGPDVKGAFPLLCVVGSVERICVFRRVETS